MAAPAAPAYEAMTPDQRGEELFKASETGNLEVVNTLLGMETNIEFVDVHRATPLFIAAANGHTVVVERLLAAGANKEGASTNTQTPLYVASMNGHAEVVKRLLIAGANREGKDKYKQTPLVIAVSKGHIDVIRHLLGAGANVNVRVNGIMLKNQLPNEDIKRIFVSFISEEEREEEREEEDENNYDASYVKGYINGLIIYEVGDKVKVPVESTLDNQLVAATVVEVTTRRYVLTPDHFKNIETHLFKYDSHLAELIHFVFPHLVPDKEPIKDLPNTSLYKTNERLLYLLRSLNDPSDSLEERNKKISEIITMNDPAINYLISVSRRLIYTKIQGIKVEFEYSPGVFAYYISTYRHKGHPQFIDRLFPYPYNLETGIYSTLPKYSLEQVLAITDWVKDNILPFYLARPDIIKTVLTSPFVLEPSWRDFQNMMNHEFDLLYDAASPTTEELTLYRATEYWPITPVRRRTIFATSFRPLTKFGTPAIVKIPPGTRILDLSKDFNAAEEEVLVFPSARDANMVIEPQAMVQGRPSYIIRNVRNGNEHLPRSRRRSRRNNKNRRSTRRRRS